MTNVYTDRQLAVLFTVLAEGVGAGGSPTALRACATRAPGPVRGALVRLAQRLADGASFGDAVAADPRIPRVYAELLSEGAADSTHLTALTALAARRAARRRHLRRGMAGPIVLSALAVLALCVASGSSWYASGRFDWARPTGGLSQVVIGVTVGMLLLQSVWLVLAVSCALRLRLAYRLPLVGPALAAGEQATLAEHLSALLRADVRPPQALRIAADGLAWGRLARAARDASESISEGKEVCPTFAMPPTLGELVAHGRRSAPDLERLGDDLHSQSIREVGRAALYLELAVLVMIVNGWFVVNWAATRGLLQNLETLGLLA